MDYVYKGAWSDQLQAKVREWVTGKFLGWKEEDPGGEFAEYVQELIVTGKKSIAEIETAFEELALGEGRARELAIGLGDLLHKCERASSSVASSSNNSLLGPLRTGREANKAPTTSPRSEEPAQMGALRTNREGRDSNSNDHPRTRDNRPTDNRPARDAITKHLQQPAQQQQQQRDIHSRLGKRVFEDDFGHDKRNRRDTSTQPPPPQSESQHDTIAYISRMNKVAQEAGFANAREMMAMLGPNALQPGPLIPPHVPPLPYGAPPGPYMGQQGGGGEWYPPQNGGWGYGHGYPPQQHMDPNIMGPHGGYPQHYHNPHHQQQEFGYNRSYVPGGQGAGRGSVDGRTGRGGRGRGQPPPPAATSSTESQEPASVGTGAHADTIAAVTKEEITTTTSAATSTAAVNGRGAGGRGGRGRVDQSFSWVNPGLVNGKTAITTNVAQQAPLASAPTAVAVSRNPFAVGGGTVTQSAAAPAQYVHESAFSSGRGVGGRFSSAGRNGGRGYAGRTNNVFALAAAANASNGGPGAIGNAPQHKVWVRPTDTESSLANGR